MPTFEAELKKLAALAYLELDADSTQQLAHDVVAIMSFVEQLRQVDTSTVSPLLNPLHMNQRLRVDDVTEENHVSDLAKMAPLFAEDLYLVPKVIETGK
jgi:aspartyl-tRNA(Asn)/glutamyl-tRNA(Gln) amidotransferase subunit C